MRQPNALELNDLFYYEWQCHYAQVEGEFILEIGRRAIESNKKLVQFMKSNKIITFERYK